MALNFIRIMPHGLPHRTFGLRLHAPWSHGRSFSGHRLCHSECLCGLAGNVLHGDALAHSVLPGIVFAYWAGFSLLWGALGAAVLVVAGIGWASRKEGLREDAAIGVVFAGFFALGILMLSKVATAADLGHILFGNILGVSKQDLVFMAVVTIFVVLATVLAFKELVAASFDPSHARAIGLSPSLVRFILLGLLALTTVVALRTVGVVLVLALLVTPGAAASMVSKRLGASWFFRSPLPSFPPFLVFMHPTMPMFLLAQPLFWPSQCSFCFLQALGKSKKNVVNAWLNEIIHHPLSQ